MVSQNVDWNREWAQVTADSIPPQLARRIEGCVEGTLRNYKTSEAKGDPYILVLSYRQQVNGSPIGDIHITEPRDAVERALLDGLSSTGKELWLIDGYTDLRNPPFSEDGKDYYPYYALKL